MPEFAAVLIAMGMRMGPIMPREGETEMQLCHRITADWGAGNTVYFKDGKPEGMNRGTDEGPFEVFIVFPKHTGKESVSCKALVS